MIALAALSPIALALVLLVGLRIPASRAMPVCALAAAGLSLGLWQTPVHWVGAAIVEAAVITVSILYIVFGAILLLAVMKRGGAVAALQQSLGRLTPDLRLQAVLVAYLGGIWPAVAPWLGALGAFTGILGQEGAILRRTAPPLLVYGLLATAVGLLFA